MSFDAGSSGVSSSAGLGSASATWEAAIDTNNPTVWRGDSRTPDEVFQTGFMPRPAGLEVPANRTTLQQHVFGERVGPWVSTTTNQDVAEDFAGNNGWVYAIDRPQNGVDVNQELGVEADEAYGVEEEVAVPYGVANNDIRYAYRINAQGQAETPVIINPNYNPYAVDAEPPIPPPAPIPEDTTPPTDGTPGLGTQPPPPEPPNDEL